MVEQTEPTSVVVEPAIEEVKVLVVSSRLAALMGAIEVAEEPPGGGLESTVVVCHLPV